MFKKNRFSFFLTHQTNDSIDRGGLLAPRANSHETIRIVDRLDVNPIVDRFEILLKMLKLDKFQSYVIKELSILYESTDCVAKSEFKMF